MEWEQITKFIQNEYDPFDFSTYEENRLKEIALFTEMQGIFSIFYIRILDITKFN